MMYLITMVILSIFLSFLVVHKETPEWLENQTFWISTLIGIAFTLFVTIPLAQWSTVLFVLFSTFATVNVITLVWYLIPKHIFRRNKLC